MKKNLEIALLIVVGFLLAAWLGFEANKRNQEPRLALAADTKISGLGADATPDSADYLVTQTTTANYKATIANVLGTPLNDIRGLTLNTNDVLLYNGTHLSDYVLGTGIAVSGGTIQAAASLIDIANITGVTGDILWWNGSDYVALALGGAGYLLKATTSGLGWSNTLGIGTLDMASGIFELPQGTAVANDGEINLDFTDGSMVVQHGAAHAELGASTDVVMAKLIHSFNGVYVEPDQLQLVNDDIALVGIHSSEFPHGIVITDIIVTKCDTATPYVLSIDNWNTLLTINATTATFDAVSMTTAEEEQEQDAITFSTVGAGQYIMIDLPATDIPYFTISVQYFEPIA